MILTEDDSAFVALLYGALAFVALIVFIVNTEIPDKTDDKEVQ